MSENPIPKLDGYEAGNRRHKIGGNDEPVLWVRPGEKVCFATLDASGNQITQATQSADELDPEAIFPVTGPVGIEGVEPGDVVGVEITSIVPADRGHMWTRPGIGFGAAPGFLVREVDVGSLSWHVAENAVRLPSRMMAGTVAVAPSVMHQARDLGPHGGNLDTPELGPGAIVWLRAQRPGGGVYVGDVHVAMGDAEVCGTGVEVAAEVYVRLHVAHGWVPTAPLVTNNERVWIIGIGKSIEEALEAGLSHVMEALRRHMGLSSDDAYLTAAALLEVRICQVVNPHVSVAVSLTNGLDRYLTSGLLREERLNS